MLANDSLLGLTSRDLPTRHLKSLSTALLSLALLSATQAAFSADVGLEWDKVDDSRVAYYEVHWGTQSGSYQNQVSSTSTSTTLTGLADGTTYYVAARACAEGGTQCSDYSNELTVTPQSAKPAAPVASFTESGTSGTVPFVVTFSSTSEGAVDACQWSFSNGQTATGCQVAQTFAQAGTFSVSLTVKGPGGTDATSKSALISANDPNWGWGTTDPANPGTHPAFPGNDTGTSGTADLPIEVGEISVDHHWQRVDFASAFNDPVVIAKSFSKHGGQAATVRISGVDQTGFWVSVQEWEYLDGAHVKETVSYVAIERGQYQLPNGAWIEADTMDVSAADGLYQQTLMAPFGATPVVIAAVASDNDDNAVTTRLRKIGPSSFEVALQEQEVSNHSHGSETISYIAWEPSTGQIEGLSFEVAEAADQVTHKGARIDFASQYKTPPAVLADMQTRNGGDTAVLRWSHKDAASMDVWVQEEQSRDRETSHIKESVGYILLSDTGSIQP